MMSLLKKVMMTVSMLLVLTSCSLLSPVKTEPQSSFVLNSIPAHMTRHRTHPITIMVLQPDINQTYNTTDMAYSVRPFQIAYFAQNRWSETPAQMLQPLLVQTLQNTHFFQAVVTAPYTGQYEYLLTSHILELKQDFTHRIPMLRLVVRIQLTNMSTNHVVATRLFCISEPMMRRMPYCGVLAANCATAKLLAQIATFVVQQIN